MNETTSPDPASAADATGPPPAGARTAPPPPPPASAPKGESQVPRQLAGASKAAGRQLLRPRVRVTLLGIAFLVAAWLWVDGSVGTLLTVAGVLMLLVAWLGSRMEGRFAVEWGAGGTKVEFGNALAPAPEPFRAPAQPALNPARASAKGLAAVPAPVAAAAASAPADIDGEAHTVEIDVAELKALIAAAERAA